MNSKAKTSSFANPPMFWDTLYVSIKCSSIPKAGLGSVQVLYKQVFPNSGPPPLNKQNKHGPRLSIKA